jgi:hypothetical protein
MLKKSASLSCSFGLFDLSRVVLDVRAIEALAGQQNFSAAC